MFVRMMLHWCVALAAAVGVLILSHGTVFAETNVLVTLTTGGDDLRGGNSAFIRVNLNGRASTREVLLTTGAAGNSHATKRVTFAETFTAAEVRSITIRHDGNPRSGHPFDHYDNWNLDRVLVQMANSSFVPVGTIYKSNLDLLSGYSFENFPLKRFTGDARTLLLPVRSFGAEPDFTILSIVAKSGSRGLAVVVHNIGGGDGNVRSVICSTLDRLTTHNLLATPSLRRGARRPIDLSFLPRRGDQIICSVVGVRLDGAREFNTSNNKRIQSF